MDEEHVTYVVEDGIARITLRRPEQLNAMTDAMRRRILECFARFESDDAARVAILTGEGRAFCAGADLKEMATSGFGAPPTLSIPHIGRNVEVTKPTIAEVNGIAYAGGFLLAQMCDLCTAAEDAQFGLTEVRWGRGAPFAGPLLWMLPQRIMMELLITGEPLSARRAYELGFVNRIAPRDRLPEVTTELARIIIRNAPLGVKAGRRLTYLAAETGRMASVGAGDLAFQEAYASSDALEGPRAFREKREPRWQGR